MAISPIPSIPLVQMYIGAKAKVAGQPTHIYIPFIAEAQDGKLFRVVMVLEQWLTGQRPEPQTRLIVLSAQIGREW